MSDSTPSPRRTRWFRTAGWLLVLITTGCNGESSVIKGIPSPSGFAGDWMMLESAPQGGACTIQHESLGYSCPFPIRTEDAFGGLVTRMPAKTLLAPVSGGVVKLADVTQSPGATCTLTYTKIWTGVLETPDRVSGEWAVTMSGSCYSGPACASQGTFTWNRCPDSGCVEVLCPA